MTGKAKLEGLTNAWYGFAVFSALFGLLMNGIGLGSIVSAVGGLLFSWVLTWFIGRSLMRKSGLMRLLLILVTGFGAVTGVYATGKLALMFVQTFELKVILATIYTAVNVYMTGRSLRTLLDGSVKTYFNSAG